MFIRFITIMLVLLMRVAVCCEDALAVTVGVSDGTYDFGSLGVDNSLGPGTGYARLGDKFKVRNDQFASWQGAETGAQTAIYHDSLTYTYTAVIKAEGGAVCKSFTFKDLGISASWLGQEFKSFDISFWDKQGIQIGTTLSLGPSVVYSTSAVTSIRDLYQAQALWPAAGVPGVATIEIAYTLRTNGVDEYASALNLENITIADVEALPAAPAVFGVFPGSGSTTGGTDVTITGADFIAGAAVKFGDSDAVDVTVVSSTTITATTPASVSPRSVDTIVTTSAGISNVNTYDVFTYNSATGTADGVYDFGSLGVADSAGTGYAKLGDKFKVPNDRFTEWQSLNTGQYTAINPDPSTSSTNAAIIKAEGGSTCKTFTFKDLWISATKADQRFADLKIVLKALDGSTIVERQLANSNSYPTNQKTKLSDLFAQGPWSYNNVATIELFYSLTAGGSPTSAWDLNLENIDIANVNGAPTITGISLASGQTIGGDTVTITGTNFSTGASVLFGTTGVAAQVDSPTQITVTTPAGAVGAADITVMTSLGISAAVPFAYVRTNQTITFGAVPNIVNNSATVSATATSGLSPTFISKTEAICTVSGATVTIVGAGDCIIAADQGGNAVYNAAPQVTQSLGKQNQTITFNNPGAQSFGTSPSLTASATSGLSVSFSSSTTSVCTVTAGGALTFVTAGTCTIKADQGGDGSFNEAPPVLQSFKVNAVLPGAPASVTAVGGRSSATITFSAPSNGGVAITGYTVVSNPAGGVDIDAGKTALTHTVTGLTNGTAYTFTVTATNPVGSGAASIASNSVTPATVPDAPTIGSATYGNSQVTVAFTAPASNGGAAITGYTVTASPGGATASGAASPLTVTGLTNGTAYTFTVTATNPVGTGAVSATSNSVTPATVPGAPSGVAATAGHSQATVTFSAPAANGAAITSYTVTASPGGATASGSASPVIITGLTNGTAYTFTVTATNSAGTGAASSASGSVTPATVPGAPVIGTATRGNGQATITFTAPASNGGAAITSYTATASPGGATASGAASPLTITGLTNGTAYTITVTATNSVGTGTASATSNSVTPATVPGAPVIGIATSGNSQATVAFGVPASNGAAITSYTVTASPGGATASGSASPVNITGLTNGTAYTFTVTATNSAGTGAASSASNSVTPATVPGAPVIGIATRGNGQATVAFTAPASNGGAAITSYTATASPGGATASGAASPLTITGLTNGTAYIFTVTAANPVGAGTVSASSNSVTPATVPDVPTGVTATAGNSRATVVFTAPASNGGAAITGYTVTVSPGGATVSGTISPIIVNGLTNDTAYTFTVTASNSVGISTASTASAPVSPAAVVDAPINVIATAGDSHATVTFGAPILQSSPPASYTYTVTVFIDGAPVATVPNATSPVTIGGLTNGTLYTFTVTTNLAGSATSNSVTPARVPDAPVIGTATAGNNQATVTFSAPASNGGATITNYTVTASPGGATASGSASPVTVTGLTNGTAYTFTVTASNSAGTGAASSASNSVTPATVPDAPLIGVATVVNNQATVTFSAPVSNGGAAITDYTVTASPGGATVSGATSPLTISGLTNGTAYTFTVTASNAVGSSVVSASSNSVTPASVPGTPAIGTALAGNSQATVAFGVPASNGAAITGYTVTASPGGATASGTASPVIITGLSNGTAYTFTVTATNAAGTSAASAASNSVTPATVPDAPVIGIVTATSTQATIPFTAPLSNGGAAITGYTVTASPGGATVSGAASPLTITGLTNGTAYTFTVTASNSAGSGAVSATSNSVTPATVPGAPSIGTAIAGNSQATVAFSAPAANGGAAITGYTVTASPGGATASGTVSPIIITGLTNGTAYTFTVTATNSVGTGAASIASSSVTPSTNKTLKVSVNNVSRVYGVQNPVFTATFSGFDVGETVAVLSGAPTFSTNADSNSSAGKYQISVGIGTLASNKYGFSFENGTLTINPASQTITFADPGTQNFVVSKILTATASSGLSPTFTSSTNDVCTITGDGNLTMVSAGICTINADQSGNNNYSPAPQVSRSFSINAVLPGAPAISGVTAGDSQVTVTLNAPASNGGAAITGYTVVSNPAGGIDSNAGTAGLSHVITGLTNGTAYTFTVTATNSVGTGVASDASNSVTPVTVPGVPFGVTATGGSGQATVTFSAPVSDGGAAISGYTVVSNPAGGVDSNAGTTALSHVITGLTNGTAYTFTVTATNSVGTGVASNASNSVTPVTVPGVPFGVTATGGNSQAIVTFSAPASDGGAAISGYTVVSSPAGGVDSNAGTTALSHVITGLANGTAYTFTVIATNAAGSSDASSASAGVTPAANQVISFDNPGDQVVGTTPAFTATSSSGLLPAFSSLTTEVCSITADGSLSSVKLGVCTIAVNQGGNSAYNAASQVTQSFNIIRGTLALSDILKAYRIALNLQPPSATDRIRCDVAPLDVNGKPEGNNVIDFGDVIIMLRNLVGLVTW